MHKEFSFEIIEHQLCMVEVKLQDQLFNLGKKIHILTLYIKDTKLYQEGIKLIMVVKQ